MTKPRTKKSPASPSCKSNGAEPQVVTPKGTAESVPATLVFDPVGLGAVAGNALMEAFDLTRAAAIKRIELQYGIPYDAAVDVVHRALVRFLADTSDEDILAAEKAAV